MKNARTVYAKAAKILENRETVFAGHALDLAGQPEPGGFMDASPLQRRWEEVFDLGYLGDFPTRDESILSLCFMAAISATR